MNVLISVDGSAASAKAVGFVEEMYAPQKSEELAVTLFHVVESLPDDFLARAEDSRSAASYSDVRGDWESARHADGERLLEEHKQALVKAGIRESGIEKKLVVRSAERGAQKVIAALAIIEEMKAGDYDVVCLGRRGASGVEGSFLGSVAEKVLREAQGRTVCVVD